MRLMMKYLILFLITASTNRASAQRDTWIHTGGPLNGQYACGVISLTMDSTVYLYAGTSRYGLYRYNLEAKKWQAMNPGISQCRVYSIATKPNGYIFVASDSGIDRSTDKGNSWMRMNNGLIHQYAEVIAIMNNGNIFAGSDGIYRSTNNGEEWIPFGSGGVPSLIVSHILFVNNGYIIAAGRNKIFRSSDNGTSWDAINSWSKFWSINSMKTNSKGEIFVGSGTQGIMRSTNLGNTWEIYGQPGQFVSDIIFDQNENMYAGIADAVVVSTDQGFSWSDISVMLVNKNISTLLIDPLNNLYAGTEGGVFRYVPISTSVAEEKQKIHSFNISTNYPNPISLSGHNSSATIEYRLPSQTHVQIKLFDILGREIATLVDEETEAGFHKAKFDLRTSRRSESSTTFVLCPGVYFYRLYADKIIITKKMIVTR